jgi:hypothetical protein
MGKERLDDGRGHGPVPAGACAAPGMVIMVAWLSLRATCAA